MTGLAAASVLLWTAGQVPLPGTQPNELTLPPEPSSTCSCHDSFDPEGVTEPGQSYRATLMALSARDPLFRAAFQVARRDRPNLTDLCLRCHAPTGWLNGRSEGTLEELTSSDLESVTCDVCHRSVASEPPLIGSGQYTISPMTAKRSRRGSAPFGGHPVLQTEFTASAEMCGTCHSLFNPAEPSYGPDAQSWDGPYYEQRTYEEWRDSVFGARNETCIDCHMAKTQGAAARGGPEYEDLHVHGMVGGNDFAVNAVRLLNPNLPIAREASQVGEWVEANLRRAVALEVRTDAVRTRTGETFDVTVRVTNRTGHKLPTGYPEGRRVYLEVALELDGQPRQVLTGAWDQATGDVVPDPQLRTYETEHGRVEGGVGARTRHLILMNQIISDTRIPPEGFMPQHPDMVPAGRDYGSEAPYRHWDEPTFTFDAPEVSATTTGTVTVRVMHQTTDGHVVRFLLENAAGTPEAEDLRMVWEQLGHAPPKVMAEGGLAIVVEPPPPAPDAGVRPPDAGVRRDAGTGDGDASGCRAGGAAGWAWALLGLLGLRRRRASS